MLLLFVDTIICVVYTNLSEIYPHIIDPNTTPVKDIEVVRGTTHSVLQTKLY